MEIRVSAESFLTAVPGYLATMSKLRSAVGDSFFRPGWRKFGPFQLADAEEFLKPKLGKVVRRNKDGEPDLEMLDLAIEVALGFALIAIQAADEDRRYFGEADDKVRFREETRQIEDDIEREATTRAEAVDW